MPIAECAGQGPTAFPNAGNQNWEKCNASEEQSVL
jgi:hypothetical protein